MKHSINSRGNLVLEINQEERALLASIKEEEPDRWGTNDLMFDFFEGFTSNSEFDWVCPEEIGALTSAPVLGTFGEDGIEGVTDFPPHLGLRDVGSDGENKLFSPILSAYGYMNYQVRFILDDLLDHGFVELQSGEEIEDDEPTIP